VSRLPIRVRLTAVFALAMIVVLAGAALFVYLRLRADLDDSVNASLAARADAVAASGDPRSAAVGDPEEAVAQVLRAGSSSAILPGGLGRQASRGPIVVERRVRGFEGTMRLLARPSSDGATVVVVGQSLDDRDETLTGLLASFAIGGPIAVLLASLLGYALSTASLRPVEAMRRRAEDVSLVAHDVLPLPAARDEIRRLGETLNSMLDRLRGSFDRERRFVADASHELRTPIAVLQTELETLLRREHPPDVREALLAAADEADHLARLADDLLLLARSSEGVLEVRPEPLDAGQLLADARARFEQRAAARGRGIELDVVPGTALHADPLRTRQALGNLVDNALRHGAGDVVLAARAAGGGVAIEVTDGGDGFAAGIADRAFERFARGDEARTRGGAGLGLAIVRAIAEAHGGSAEIVAGSRVRIWLPSQAHFSAVPQSASVPT
jgi:two-component system, OmpR family, sensor kinase